MRRKLAVLGIILAIGCGPSAPSPPPVDGCDRVGSGAAEAIEIGVAGSAELDGQPAPFTALVEGGAVPTIRGGQGAQMIGWRLRLSGASVPDCILEKLAVTAPPSEYPVALSDRPVR